MFKQMISGKYMPHQVRFPTCCHPVISGYPAQFISAYPADGYLVAQLPSSQTPLGASFPQIECCPDITAALIEVATAIIKEPGASKDYKKGVVIHGVLTGVNMALQGIVDDPVGDFGAVDDAHFVGLYAAPWDASKNFKDTIDLGMRRADLMRAMKATGWTNGEKDGPLWMMPRYEAADEMALMTQCDKWRDQKHPIYCTYSRKRFPDFGIYGGVAWDHTLPFHQQLYARPTNNQIDNGIL